MDSVAKAIVDNLGDCSSTGRQDRFHCSIYRMIGDLTKFVGCDFRYSDRRTGHIGNSSDNIQKTKKDKTCQV
jgi:hypothetical protein